MKKDTFAASLLIIFMGLFYMIPMAQTLDNSTDYNNLPPSEIHKIMGEMKAGNLERQQAFADYAAKTKSYISQEEYDVQFYRIQLEVDVTGEYIYGDVQMVAEALSDGFDSVEVDLFNNIIVDSVYNASGTLNYTHVSDKLLIELDQVYNNGESFTISVAYNGHPTGSGLDGFSFDINEYGHPVVASLSEPYSARSWWPCKDRTDDKADSIDITVTCDTSYYCASNGTLIDNVDNGDGTWTFDYEVRYPIVTYLFSIAIADYTVWTDWYYYGTGDSMPVVNHVYPERYVYSLSTYNITPYAIGVLSDIFGPYPFLNEKYGHASFEWGGAMEHQTVSSMSGSNFGFSEPVVVHELGHQWWGDMITCGSWHDIWLNEGFASYCEALYYEVKDGKAEYHDYMDGMSYTNGGTIYVYDTTNAWNIFNLIVYDKGAWVLHMLRHVVGDSIFFDILPAYYNSEFQYGSALTADFQNICETVSGMDLDYFFDEWIYGQYFPRYFWSYMTEFDPIGEKYFTYFYLRQGQATTPNVFVMPIDLVINYGSHVDTTVIFNDRKENVYIFKTDDAPVGIALDPDDWILKENTSSAWTYHQIPFGLDTAVQYQTYLDSIVVKGGSGDNKYSIFSGVLPDGLELDSITGYIQGTPTEFGLFTFEVFSEDVSKLFSEEVAEYSLYVEEGSGFPGDANEDDIVNILDITFLINYLYRGGEVPGNPPKADPNNTCTINLLDVTYLINYLYKGGPPPLWGCAVL